VTATIPICAPLREGVPTPKAVQVRAGDYRDWHSVYGFGGRPGPPTVRVPDQDGRVVGTVSNYPQMLVVLNVEVQGEPIPQD
jgi:hypothetical protein